MLDTKDLGNGQLLFSKLNLCVQMLHARVLPSHAKRLVLLPIQVYRVLCLTCFECPLPCNMYVMQNAKHASGAGLYDLLFSTLASPVFDLF